MKISFFGLWPELEKYTKQKMRGLPCSITTKQLASKNIDAKTELLVVFIESPVTKKILATMPKLAMIATMSTGYDHIDLVECHKRGIVVCNVPAYGENTVAEHTFALLLGLTRKIFPSVERVKKGKYVVHGLRRIDLHAITLGVIGTGHSGAHVIRMAKGFDVKIIAYDAFPNKQLAATLGFTYVPLPKLLASADILTLHTPLFKETYHLINSSNIKKMKRGSFIINTARGALIEPKALTDALKSGHIAGAGLDVLEDEQLLQHHEQVMSANKNAT